MNSRGMILSSQISTPGCPKGPRKQLRGPQGEIALTKRMMDLEGKLAEICYISF